MRYRERKAPAGAKDDPRVDGHGWQPLVPDDSLVAELRLLTRDEIALIGQRATLGTYYSAALAAFDTWSCEGCWSFVENFPTPAALVTSQSG